MKTREKTDYGFTVMETVVAIAIGLLILGAIIFSIIGFQNKKTLEKNVGSAKVLLEQARAQSVSSKNDLYYGVHLQSDKLVLFSAVSTSSAYNPSATDNVTLILDSGSVSLDNINLADSGAELVFLFNKITGTAAGNNYGSFRLKLLKNTASTTATSTIINVSSEGVISQQ
ncbi:MAG: hypothetical protein WCO30_02550 [bacterium]